MTDRFFNRLNKIFQKIKDQKEREQQQVAPSPTLQPPQIQIPQRRPEDGPLTLDRIREIIIEAGRQELKVEIIYNGKMRLVEPYSFRRAQLAPYDLRLYGRCLMTDHPKPRDTGRIHQFVLSKIQHIRMTDIKYESIWINEFIEGSLDPNRDENEIAHKGA